MIPRRFRRPYRVAVLSPGGIEYGRRYWTFPAAFLASERVAARLAWGHGPFPAPLCTVTVLRTFGGRL